MNILEIKDRNLANHLSQSVAEEGKCAVNPVRLNADIDFADQTMIELNDDAMNAFSEELERPAKDLPQLRKLFSKKTISEI